MNYYFDNCNRLQISGSDYTDMRANAKEIYKFKHITLPLGSGFSQFLNANIEKWGNSFKSLLTKIISEYDENDLLSYIAEAQRIFSEVAYFSVYHEIFYEDILSVYKHRDSLILTCRQAYDFLETKTTSQPLIEGGKIHRIEGEIDRLKKIQNLFKKLSNVCLSPNNLNPIKSLYKNQEMTFQERTYKLTESKLFNINNSLGNHIRFEVNKLGKEKYELVEAHTTCDIYDICYAEFIKLIVNNLRVKQCKNCDKYFVPENRFDTLYCDNCKTTGAAMKVYQEKVKNDPVLSAYNKAYQSRYAKLIKPFRNNEKVKNENLKTLRAWVYKAKNKIGELENLSEDERVRASNEVIQWFSSKEVK